jgi:DNA-nicking Smr family endonuclease
MKKPGKNKSGIPVLQDDEDLTAHFLGEEPSGRGPGDFVALLEQSLDATAVQDALETKEANGAGLSPERMTEQLRQYPRPQSELDLHHYTASDAAARTEYFIRSAAQRGLKTLRVITGKGLHSGGRAVLPDVVEQVLVSLKRKDIVLTFVWEHRSKTRSGSVIVYLRKKSPDRT